MKKIHIAGAGLGGMVAALNLARKGHEVHVHEAAAELGGIGNFHPSLHVTPIDREWVSGFIGVDISGHFIETDELRFWIRKDAYRMQYPTLCFVERGNRPGSLDRHLFRTCEDLGVKFSFNDPVRSPADLPPGSIVACGLHPPLYRALGIPHQRIYASYLALDPAPREMDRSTSVYFDDYTTDYYYGGCVNRLWYGLLFGREPIREQDREACLRHLESREGVRIREWKHITGCVPTGAITNPRLFAGRTILAGSMSGMMDPFFLFGIHGALLSGKIAALAVDDPEEALKQFRDLNRNFWKSYLLRKGYESMPFGFALFRKMISHPRLFSPLTHLLGRGIPGGPRGWFSAATRTTVPGAGEVPG
jgi:flavin-dependent dehydrogenase